MASIKNLHLQYRLWIAEMNADINVLRIFDDYLAELAATSETEKVKEHIQNFKSKFINVRKEMDDLRHELHLNKMRLGAMAKDVKDPDNNFEKEIGHDNINKRYNSFRKDFDMMRKEFQAFEANN